MDHRSKHCGEQFARKPAREPHMFEIAFFYRARMIEKQTCDHEFLPLSVINWKPFYA